MTKDKKLTPLIHNGDYHAQIKQIILGKENAYPELALPKKISSQLGKLNDKQKLYQKDNLVWDDVQFFNQSIQDLYKFFER